MILAGKIVAEKMLQEAKMLIEEQTSLILGKKQRYPKITIVVLGDDAASKVYIRNKLKACSQVGIINETVNLALDCSEAELLSEIDKLNADNSVDGILVQLPLPKHINVEKVQARICADKDVDGFSAEHMGACWLNIPSLRPCTPAGIMRLIDYYNIDLTGLNVLIIGRSNIVAKPLAALLLQKNATVTIAHSKTRNLFALTKQMDLIVTSVGKASFLPKEAIKPGVKLIDVGINRNAEGKLVGDVDPACYELASDYTPVPGGVGPLTVAQLILNAVQAWQVHLQKQAN